MMSSYSETKPIHSFSQSMKCTMLEQLGHKTNTFRWRLQDSRIVNFTISDVFKIKLEEEHSCRKLLKKKQRVKKCLHFIEALRKQEGEKL